MGYSSLSLSLISHFSDTTDIQVMPWYEGHFPLFVFEPTEPTDGLLTLSALKAVCAVDDKMRASPLLDEYVHFNI